jgi:hypothetical protein
MRLLRLFAAAAILSSPFALLPAGAQVESTPVPAPAKPDFSSVSFMLGTWTCSTKSSRRPGPFITTTTYRLDPSGYWINETSTVRPTSFISTRLTLFDKISYDPDTKRWVDVLYGDRGAYALSFSKGWDGNQMTWHDVSFAPGADISSQTDTTITKVSATKTTSSSAFTETKTGRHVTVNSTCTKVS